MTSHINRKLSSLAAPLPAQGDSATNALPAGTPIFSDDCRDVEYTLTNFPIPSDDSPDAEQTFTRIFRGTPLPLGLTFDEAVGPLRERVRDFFEYPVQSP